MSFVNINPRKLTGQARITGSFSINKRSEVGTFYISIPSSIAGKSWDDIETIDVAMGEGDDAGQIAVTCQPDGAFRFSRLKSTLTIRVHEQAGWAGREFAHVPLEITHRSDNAFHFRLPKQLFERVEVAAAIAPAPVSAVNRTGPPAFPVFSGTTLTYNKKTVSMTGQMAMIAGVLCRRFGKIPISLDHIIKEFSTPIAPEVAQTVISQLRKRIEPLGLVINKLDNGYAMEATT